MPFADKIARRAWMRKWIADRRREWFEKNGPCKRCGSHKDLHLFYPDISIKLTHRVWSWSQQRRDEELSKCEVLCVDCWKAAHASTAPCGTVTRYDRGCRCYECRKANALIHRQDKTSAKEYRPRAAGA